MSDHVKDLVAIDLLIKRVEWFKDNLGHKTVCYPIRDCFTCRARELAKKTLDEVKEIWTQ